MGIEFIYSQNREQRRKKTWEKREWRKGKEARKKYRETRKK